MMLEEYGEYIPYRLRSPLNKIKTLFLPLTHTSVISWLVLVYLTINLFNSAIGYYRPADHMASGVDGIHYYIYLPSLWLDHDLDFKNQLDWAYDHHYYQLNNENGRYLTSPSGKPGNQWSIGPAILLSPFFLMAHLCILITGMDPQGGFSPYHQLFCFAGNSLYGFMAVILLGRFLQHYVKPSASLFGCLGILLSSSHTYYLNPIGYMPPGLSVFSMALLLWAWHYHRISTLTGIFAGLMFITRWQYVLVIIPLLGCELWEKRSKFPLIKFLRFSLAFWLVAFIQLSAWKSLYESFFTVPHGTSQWAPAWGHVYEVLFGSMRGAFFLHPFLILGFIGFFLPAPKWLKITAWGLFAGQLTVIASSADWAGGHSFGQRFFDGMLPFWGMGAAFCIQFIHSHKRMVQLLWILLLISALWNQAFIFQYQAKMIPRTQHLTHQQWLTDKIFIHRAFKVHQHLFEARTALNMGNNRLYLGHVLQAIKIGHPHYKMDEHLALAYLLSGDLAQATAVYQKLHEANPDILIYRKVLIFIEQFKSHHPDSNPDSISIQLKQENLLHPLSELLI